MQLEIEKMLNCCAHRLEESNKIFNAMDAAETNVPAKMYLRQTMKDNQVFIDAARKRATEIEEDNKQNLADAKTHE